MLTSSSPIFAAYDVEATVNFYVETLGFTGSWTYGEPAEFGAVSWGKFTIMFSLDPELAGRVEGQSQWIDVDDVDGLYALHLERGAMIVSEIEDKPWGRREYTVRDPNGYLLRFGGQSSHESKGLSALPEGVEIIRRAPTQEEFDRVAGAAFYKGGAPGTLERTWAAVVAVDPDGDVIGTTRIMCDAPGWFSIWDVAVDPEWQARRIGTAMMTEALAIVKEESPNAFVYLFTFKPEFYERLGFAKDSVLVMKL